MTEFNLKRKTVLVTGGTGLVGRFTVPILLSEGAKVYCISRKKNLRATGNLSYIEADLRQVKQLTGQIYKIITGPIDAIIYLAASIPSLTGKKETISEAKSNTLDPLTDFLDCFLKTDSRIVYTSTADVYGNPEKTEFGEDLAPAPHTPYALAKYCGEEYLKFYCDSLNCRYNILRFSQIYGPGESLVRIIPFIIRSSITGTVLPFWGNLNDSRKYLYAEDAARAAVAALKKPDNETINIAGKEEITIRTAISTVESLTGHKVKIDIGKTRDYPLHILPNTDKAVAILGFKPKYDFRQGIRKTVEFFTEDNR